MFRTYACKLNIGLIIAMVIWVIFMGYLGYMAGKERAQHNNCKEAGGIPYRSLCLNSSAIIELKGEK